MVVLDTCFVIDLLRSKEPAVKIFNELEYKDEPFLVATPTISELWLGALQVQTPAKEKQRIEGFLNGATILSFTAKCAKLAAEIEFELERRNIFMNTEDMQIAATTIINGEMLVTRDAQFAQIDALRLLKY